MEPGTRFYKLSGSGNDFVAFDQMDGALEAALPSPDEVRALCRRGTGVGADGVMVLQRAPGVDYHLVYYNADGSRATLCGNASLCSVRLATALGYASPEDVRFLTDAGPTTGRMADGLAEIDLAPPTELEPSRADLHPDGRLPSGDRRIGFARVGVPHVVILCDDARAVDLLGRAPALRHHPALRDGANVNFVSRTGDRYAIRTFERGVEAETLACGTGSVATAMLLAAWGEPASSDGAGAPASGRDPARVTELVTSSGLVHRVTIRASDGGGLGRPSLAGSACIVYRGELGEGDWSLASGRERPLLHDRVAAAE